MFSKATLFFTAAVVIVAAGATPTTSQCNTGPVQCCDHTQQASGPTTLTGIGEVDLGDTSTLIAYGNCSPVLPVLGGPKCQGQTVCCDNTEFEGLVNVGCTNVAV
ncbi:hydrophobin 12 [Pleurotus ostreatus PC15]|uniref:Class I hydrophobin 12 n=2 Tax=Pleurotus TaxID=5320 RepID=HYD12_PLEO1|nr:hypothetical protein CCMSSC00406_0002958 [Pleurotus cornucopiae]KDQ22804.1 hydrophobin 12 [Pleurotus ostreatus PC15]